MFFLGLEVENADGISIISFNVPKISVVREPSLMDNSNFKKSLSVETHCIIVMETGVQYLIPMRRVAVIEAIVERFSGKQTILQIPQ